MGLKTGISWCTHTWNPWQGCHKLTPGCAHCYMFAEKIRYGQDPNKVVRSKTTFNAPLKWPKEPALVFTCSWSDWFIEEADAWRDEAWAIIRATPHLTYQILTKRIERAADHLPPDWPLPNVWLGVSVEDQKRAHRVIDLLNIDAAQHFVSYEPALGPLDLEHIAVPKPLRDSWMHLVPVLGDVTEINALRGEAIQGRVGFELKNRLSWVIPGGESGPDRRDCEIEWLTNVVDQCRRNRVACFVKQDSALKSGQQGRIPDNYFVHEFPAEVPANA